MKARTVTVEVGLDTAKFDASLYRLWWLTWRVRIARRPVLGRVAFGWAWLRRPKAWKRIGWNPDWESARD